MRWMPAADRGTDWSSCGLFADSTARERDDMYAEDHHQQYLSKNANGYRCHSATGIKVPRA